MLRKLLLLVAVLVRTIVIEDLVHLVVVLGAVVAFPVGSEGEAADGLEVGGRVDVIVG